MANLRHIKRPRGNNFAKNVIDGYLFFDTAQTWTASTGTGSGTLDNTIVYVGNNSLKAENTDPTNDLILTNSTQSTIIDVGGDFDLSLYAQKNDANVAYSGAIEVFKNATPYVTYNFTIGGDGSDDYLNKDYNQEWISLVSDTPLTFVKSDVMTIRIKVDGISGYVDPSSVIWFDGLMLNARERGNEMPPQYNIPDSDIVYNVQSASGQPTVQDDTFTMWMASSGGTLDSTTYETGDVLITVNSGGTQKTVIIADFSAL